MSISSHYYHPTAGRHAPSGTQSAAAAISRHLHRAHGDYTLVHGGRKVRIGPVAFWIVVGTLVVMGLWSIATGTYFAFREDVLTRLIGRQAEMQFAYEDRIADLRAQVDRITSRQLLDQEQFEQKLSALLQRQAILERRTSALSGDVTSTGSIRPTRNALPAQAPANRPVKASPVSDAGGLDGILGRISDALDMVDRKQAAVLSNLEEHVDTRARRMRSVLSDLGVGAGRIPAGSGVGGPFVALRAPRSGTSAFERQLYRINVARAEINQYAHTLVAVPVRKPVTGEVDMSSPFGMRMDPFNGRPAIHTGIDLRGDIGEPVHATAAGKVTIASREAGYGKMVEINHGNGLATRYGHLSEIDVKVGQFVRIGEIIGKIGSTGRSTGPHLHYETRVNGEAVDPQKFLRAGVRLGSALSG
jgi:murein DD-endopeptidase MepM/ murein hydrolase activator NlpD